MKIDVRTLLISISMLLMLCSGGFSWAVNMPTPPSDHLYLAPDGNGTICLSVQNRGTTQSDLEISLEVVEGKEYAQLLAMNDGDTVDGYKLLMDLPSGTSHKPFCVLMTAPSTEVENQRISIKGTVVSSSAVSGGMVGISTGQLVYLFMTSDKDVLTMLQDLPPTDNVILEGRQVVSNDVYKIVSEIESESTNSVYKVRIASPDFKEFTVKEEPVKVSDTGLLIVLAVAVCAVLLGLGLIVFQKRKSKTASIPIENVADESSGTYLVDTDMKEG